METEWRLCKYRELAHSGGRAAYLLASIIQQLSELAMLLCCCFNLCFELGHSSLCGHCSSFMLQYSLLGCGMGRKSVAGVDGGMLGPSTC